jgi:hypothetical protein
MKGLIISKQEPCQFAEKEKTSMKSAIRARRRRAGHYGEQAKDCSLGPPHAQFLCNAQEWRGNDQASARADLWRAM